jgi:hypothetical protein
MIELIAARGNSSLESAAALTKSLRFDIQSLGLKLAKAANYEETARRAGPKSRNAAQSERSLRLIITEIKEVLQRIDDAVPLISLAITTSGASLSTSLPAAVSPSRLLQASTLLTNGDNQYAMRPSHAVQICPDFTLSVYMLFSGHAYRPQHDDGIRDTTWKEVIHKARLKLLRVPLRRIYEYPSDDGGPPHRYGGHAQDQNDCNAYTIPGEEKAYEYAYQLLIVEDLDDDRVHTYEDDNVQPGPYEGIEKAGIRELVPVHEISKIFYADTGKILNIGADGETNNPILLLKRDVNAVPPRRMMSEQTADPDFYQGNSSPPMSPTEKDEQSELDEQLFRESSTSAPPTPGAASPKQTSAHPWRLPHDLDPEWIAFEVYMEDLDEEDSGSEDSNDGLPEKPGRSPRPQSSRQSSVDPSLAAAFSRLHLWKSSPPTTSTPSPASTPVRAPSNAQLILSPQKPGAPSSNTSTRASPLPPIRTSLSLLEMLIRLTALQQFQQTSHLAIPDELLTFFLSESSTVGAGGNAELRKRARTEARQRVGFDPYDESPIKRRGEQYVARMTERHEEEAEYCDRRQLSYHHDYEFSLNEHSFPPPSSSHRSYRSPSHSQNPPGSSPYQAPSSPTPATRSGPIAPTTNAPLSGDEVLSQPDQRASPSPLLRRATAPNAGSRKRYPGIQNDPPTAPPTSSSPRMGTRSSSGRLNRAAQTPEGQAVRPELAGALDTPPESGRAF